MNSRKSWIALSRIYICIVFGVIELHAYVDTKPCKICVYLDMRAQSIGFRNFNCQDPFNTP